MKETIEVTDYNLDGVFFRVDVNGKYCNKCFSDLDIDRMMDVLEKYDKDACIKLMQILHDTKIKLINDLLTEKEVKHIVVWEGSLLKAIGKYFGVQGESNNDDC